MPIYTDAGLIYYRKDLLEKHGVKPPETWAELADAAKKIAAAESATGMQGFVFQAKAYEGLTCDALEWVASFGGGTIVDPSGKITINNPQAVAAIDTAAGWIKSGVAPQGVLNYSEEESRGVFQSGKAVFMRNWPYAWPLAQSADSPVKDKVGVLQIPMGGAQGKHASALGGWQMAVSKYSKTSGGGGRPRRLSDLGGVAKSLVHPGRLHAGHSGPVQGPGRGGGQSLLHATL